jgi:hypothetical protein
MPGTVLEEIDAHGNRHQWPVQLTNTQEYLWEKFSRDLAALEELAAGGDVVVLCNGDLTHGMKHPQSLMSNNLYHQVVIAKEVLRAWLTRPGLHVSAMRLVQGTAAHTMDGATEPIIAEIVKAEFPQADVGVIFHGLFTVEGVTVDCVHKGPYPGSREWLQGNVAALSLKSMMLRNLLDEQAPPRVVVRAHYHRYVRVTQRVESRGQTYESDLVITPSYCGMDLHGHHATQGLSWQSHGLVAFVVEEGRLVEVKPLVETLDLRTQETL